jgi:hypothetical protein
MIPWFLCNIIGLTIETSQERVGGLPATIGTSDSHLPPPGGTVYIMPPELMPYYRATLGAHDARRIEDLTAVPDTVDSVTVLNLNPWSTLQFPRDTRLLAILNEGKLAERTESWRFPPWAPVWDYYETFQLEGWDHLHAARLGANGFMPLATPPPSEALSFASPLDQHLRDGWQALEVGVEGSTWRWSGATSLKLRLRGGLEPGRYRFHLSGFRHPYPTPVTEMSIKVGEDQSVVQAPVMAGIFQIDIPVQLDRALSRPAVIIRHPVYRTADYEPGSNDPRLLGFILYSAWISRAE